MNKDRQVAAGAASVGEMLPPQRTPWRNFLGHLQRWVDLLGFRRLIDVVARRQGQAIYKVKEAPRGLPELTDVARPQGGSGPVVLITRATLIACAAPPSRAAAGDQPQQLPPPKWSLKEESYGDPLTEIFEVSANFPLRGQVLAWDGIRTQIICQGKNVKEFYSRRAKWARDNPGAKLVDFKMTLPPTGPSKYMCALFGALFQVKIDATTKKAAEEHARVVDWCYTPLSNRCNTVSIETSMGVVDVLCAMMNEAVEVTMRVSLCIPRELCAGLYGRITARTDIYEPEITVFSRGVKSTVDPLRRVAHPLPDFLSAESYRHVTLPLARTVLAVPIQASRIMFKGELMIKGSNTLSVNHSIPLDAENIWSPWVKHGVGWKWNASIHTVITMCPKMHGSSNCIS